MTEPGTLHRRREKAEAKATHISDSVVNYGVEEFARQFDVSWQAIMNDDLGKIRETPRRMLNAVRRFEALKAAKIYVRYFPGPETGEYLRITIGTEAQTDALLARIGA
jgi:hypothetical protein